MCGIAGFWFVGSAHQGMSQQVKNMAAAIAHRGPDSSGEWVDERAGLALAHQRLSILDLSEAGSQPMMSATSRYIISYNGEIYNHLSLRKQLEQQQKITSWRGTSDTETLLVCLEAWGFEKTLSSISGMFAMAIWDREQEKIYLCRDRMGEKPLYYGWAGESFIFASELKALKEYSSFQQNICRKALALFLRFNYVPAPYSIYEGVYKLLPGHYLELSNCLEKAQPRPFWSLKEIAENRSNKESINLSDQELLDRFEAILGNAVQQQCLSDVPIGALLSGGIDSSLICALMQSSISSPINTFTIGFEESAYNEADHARQLARYLKTDHTEIIFSGQDCLDLVPKLPSIYDEPFADSSQLPTVLVMQVARSKVSVALSGDGADELFAGYTRYSQVPKVWQKVGWMPEALRQLMANMMTVIPASSLNGQFSGFSQFGDKLHRLGQRLDGLSSAEDLYMALVSEWRDGIPVIGVGMEHSEAGLWQDIANINGQGVNNLPEKMMLMDGLTYLPDDILTKVDRAAMAVSLETRAPFLDPKVVEFAWSLDLQKKLDGNKGKKIMRQLLERYVPMQLIDRPKQGFAIPLDIWLRGPLRDWADQLLNSQLLEQQGYFMVDSIQDIWQKHKSGQGNYGYRLWSVLMFQCWLEEQ